LEIIPTFSSSLYFQSSSNSPVIKLLLSSPAFSTKNIFLFVKSTAEGNSFSGVIIITFSSGTSFIVPLTKSFSL